MKRFAAWIAGFAAFTVIVACVCLIVLGILIMLWPAELMAAGTWILGLTCVVSAVLLGLQMILAIREQRKCRAE